jgi:uncharacterized membrane protein YkoI
MMNKNVILSAVVAIFFGASLAGAEVIAGPCAGGVCSNGKKGQGREISVGGDAYAQGDDGFWSGQIFKRKKRQRIRPPPSYEPPPFGDEEEYPPPVYGGGGGLIGPTEALTQALSYMPGGRALGVKLLKGPNPMYAVKMRVDGRVIRVLVDARTAQVLGE